MITNSYDKILNISSMVVKQEVEAAAIHPEKISSAQSLSGIGSIKRLYLLDMGRRKEKTIYFLNKVY